MAHISELRGKSHDELKDMAVSLKKELFNLRFQIAGGETPNTARFRAVRRDIARVKTLLNEPAGTVPAVKKAKTPKAPKAEAAAKETKAKKTTAKKKAAGE